ncbi:unnamed protein product [Durusdinium trenchii]|uniref:Guanine nucleotide-binding protein subunit beta-like protein n=4 Tax=Durusdinium trenchii TaxID=1381693 RepID=A0ABP0P404_9DINO
MARVEVAYVSGVVFYESNCGTDHHDLRHSIGNLKRRLQPLCGVPAEEQHITLGPDVLEDWHLLCNLPADEGVLQLTLIRSLTRMVLSGGRDRKLMLWDLNRSDADQDLVGHTQAVRCLAVDWAGQRAMSGSVDRSLQLWDLVMCHCVLELRGHTDTVTCLSVHWESNIALSAGLDQTLLLWDLDVGEVMKELMDHASPTVCLEVDWIGRQALLIAADGAMRHWDLSQDRAEGCGRQDIQRMFVNWSNLQAITGCSDGEVLLWDLCPFQVLRSCVPPGSKTSCMSASPDLLEVALGSGSTLCLWSSQFERKPAIKALDAECLLVGLEVDWSGRSALTCGEDGQLKFWNLTVGQCLRVVGGPGPVATCMCVHWQSALAVTTENRSVKLWDLCRGRCLQSLELGCSSAVSVNWQKHQLIAAGEDSVLRLRETFRRGKCIGRLQGHMDTILCLTVNWAGSEALSGGSDRRLILWDLSEWKVRQTLRGHEDTIRCVEADWQGRRAISGSFDRSLVLWDLTSGEIVARLTGHIDWVCCSATAWHDGHCISGARDGTLRLWDLETASCTSLLTGHTGAVWAVALCFPDAFSGGQDGTIRRWCLTTGSCLQLLLAHQDAVRSLDVDWRSAHFLTGSFDSCLRMWPFNSTDYFQEFDGHRRGVTSCSVDWSCGLAVSGSEDCSIRLWDIYAEDDSSDLLLGSHEGAVLCISMGCGPSIAPCREGIQGLPAAHPWEEQVMKNMAGRVIF